MWKQVAITVICVALSVALAAAAVTWSLDKTREHRAGGAWSSLIIHGEWSDFSNRRVGEAVRQCSTDSWLDGIRICYDGAGCATIICGE